MRATANSSSISRKMLIRLISCRYEFQTSRWTKVKSPAPSPIGSYNIWTTSELFHHIFFSEHILRREHCADCVTSRHGRVSVDEAEEKKLNKYLCVSVNCVYVWAWAVGSVHCVDVSSIVCRLVPRMWRLEVYFRHGLFSVGDAFVYSYFLISEWEFSHRHSCLRIPHYLHAHSKNVSNARWQ